jgi:hypothetical protein
MGHPGKFRRLYLNILSGAMDLHRRGRRFDRQRYHGARRANPLHRNNANTLSRLKSLTTILFEPNWRGAGNIVQETAGKV